MSGVKLIPPSFLNRFEEFIDDPVQTAVVYDSEVGMSYPSSSSSSTSHLTVDEAGNDEKKAQQKKGLLPQHVLTSIDDHEGVSSMADLLEQYPVVGLSRDYEFFPHVCCESKIVFAQSVIHLIPQYTLTSVVEFDDNGYTVYVPFGSDHFFKAKRYTSR